MKLTAEQEKEMRFAQHELLVRDSINCMEANSEFAANSMHPITEIWKFVRDYRTLRFDCGQRTGKTQLIIKLATDQDLVVGRQKQDFVDHFEFRARFTTVARVLQSDFDDTKVYSTIYVDGAHRLLSSMDTEERLFRALVRSPKTKVVLLG